ncbi:ABC transporter substrate binding protein [Desulforhopalus sp. 52FAK]
MKRSQLGVVYKDFRIVLCICLLFVVTLSLFLNATSVFAAKSDSQSHVLLFNSYHKGYMWSDEITRGVEENIADSGVVLHVEYMDTKRHFNEEYLSLLSELLSLKHSKYQYDVIIVSDNNAFDFIKDRGKEIFGDTPIVFCGLNYFTTDDISGMEHVTGVNEQADLDRNIDLIKLLHPDRHKLVVITDSTITGEKIQKEILRIQDAGTHSELELELVYDVTTTELIEKLNSLDEQTSVLFTFFFRDREGVFLEYDESIALVLESTEVPVYVSWKFSMREGVMGGYLTSGYDQGVEAVEKVNQLLAGVSIEDIPVTWKSPTRFCLDYGSLKRFNVAFGNIPADADILNIPLTFVQEYKALIVKIGIIIGVLILLIIVLAYGLIRSKRAEDTLRKAENFISNIINSMPSVLVGVDSSGKVTHWNSRAKAETGMTCNEALGQPLELAFPRLGSEMERVRDAMSSREVVLQPRKSHNTDNETCYEDVTVYPLVSNGIEGAVIRLDDVTEKVRLEEMMVQSEKMLSVGGLAAGMAHEINNPLAGMIQTANVMKDRLTNENMAANIRAAEAAGVELTVIHEYMLSRGIPKMLDRICESGARAAEIVSNMLQFARKSSSTVSTHDLPEILDQCLELAGSDYDLKKRYDFRQITVVKKYQENLPPIPCEKSKIQQVILNILRNGAEAMQDNQSQVNDEHIFTLQVTQTDPDWICLEIEDNGPGMEEAIRKRVFEPFFTTKAVDMGTGLGLSVSYFIVTENHDGRMKVESVVGQGARFIIELPVKGKRV